MKNAKNIDINRHVLCCVDDNKKTVLVHLICKAEEFEEKFHKIIHALGAQYKDYDIIAPMFPLSDNEYFSRYARIY